MKDIDFKGLWNSEYSYQSGDNPPISSQHTVELSEPAVGIITGRSLPQADGSKVHLELKYDASNRVLTGTWRETTSPNGPYKGATFHGTLQLLVDDSGKRAVGQWLGYNSGHTKVKNGNWSLKSLR